MSEQIGEFTLYGVIEVMSDDWMDKTYQENGKDVMEFCRENNALYYARPRESFFKFEAIDLAEKEGKKIIVLEDMS